jgi:hypothetical protein
MFKAIFYPDPGYAPMLVTVCNVRDDKRGYPHFLVYIDNQWRYISAKYFKLDEEN